MEIVIISDTHLKKTKPLIEFANQISNVDFVIHAGDFGDYSILEFLQSHFKFTGVYGNVDSDEVRSVLNQKEIITLNSYRIGIYHGHGAGMTTKERAYSSFKDDLVDIIVFGHSHQPSISTKNKVLMLNPGSLFQKRCERWYSYILLTLTPSGIQSTLVFSTNKTML